MQDNGPGIPEHFRHRIGTRGFSGKGGHGIGIWRSKKLAREMGGELTLINNCERDDLDYDVSVSGASAIIELPASEDKVKTSESDK
jgi:signal transduction histidine kinase